MSKKKPQPPQLTENDLKVIRFAAIYSAFRWRWAMENDRNVEYWEPLGNALREIEQAVLFDGRADYNLAQLSLFGDLVRMLIKHADQRVRDMLRTDCGLDGDFDDCVDVELDMLQTKLDTLRELTLFNEGLDAIPGLSKEQIEKAKEEMIEFVRSALSP